MPGRRKSLPSTNPLTSDPSAASQDEKEAPPSTPKRKKRRLVPPLGISLRSSIKPLKSKEDRLKEREQLAKRLIELQDKGDHDRITQFIKKHGRRTTLYRDAKDLRGGGVLRMKGRPLFYGGEIGEKMVMDEVKKLTKEGKDRSKKTIQFILRETRLHVAKLLQYKNPLKDASPATKWRLKKKVLKSGFDSRKTNARFRAEHSVRNFVSWAGALGAMNIVAGVQGVHPSLLMSQDFSAVVFGDKGRVKQWVPKGWKDPLGVPSGVVRAEQRCVCVSYQATMTAAGVVAPFLICVKSPKMKLKQQIFKIEGIGATSHYSEYAYVVVDNKRKVELLMLCIKNICTA